MPSRNLALLKAFGHADPSGPFLTKGCSASMLFSLLFSWNAWFVKVESERGTEPSGSKSDGAGALVGEVFSKTNMLMLQFMDQENKKARQALDESLFLFEIAESS